MTKSKPRREAHNPYPASAATPQPPHAPPHEVNQSPVPGGTSFAAQALYTSIVREAPVAEIQSALRQVVRRTRNRYATRYYFNDGSWCAIGADYVAYGPRKGIAYAAAARNHKGFRLTLCKP